MQEMVRMLESGLLLLLALLLWERYGWVAKGWGKVERKKEKRAWNLQAQTPAARASSMI